MAAYKGAVDIMGDPKRTYCYAEPTPSPPSINVERAAIIPALTSDLSGAVADLEETAVKLWKRLDSVVLQEPSGEGPETETPQTGVIHADRIKDIYESVLRINRSLTRLIGRIEC